MPVKNKKDIRRAVRGAFPGQAERSRQSGLICAGVLAWERYRQARVVAGYIPMPHEADITPVLLDALACGKTLVLPRCGKPPEMRFHLVRSLEELKPGAFGLPEPAANAPEVLPENIDLLLTPLEAVDCRGMRLGKGGGYYDKALEKTELFALGIALEHQWVQQLPHDAWDRPVNAVADPSGIHLFRWDRGNP